MSNALNTVHTDTLPWNDFDIFCGKVLRVNTKVIELQSQMIVDEYKTYNILIPTALRGLSKDLMLNQVIALERYVERKQHRIRKVSI